jgi:hypothetical protein
VTARRRATATLALSLVCAAASLSTLAHAQQPAHVHRDSARADTARRALRAGAQVIALGTHLTPGPGDRNYTEGYLTQPVIAAEGTLASRRLVGRLTLDLEGITMERGELTSSAWGEGYVDRRHPHTYVHEALAGTEWWGRRTDVSLFAGRGFAPFGTDDPMMRPFVKYPVNHHFAQILERVVLVGALRRGPVILEAGIFNGDEPVSPGAPPEFSRFGDSWSTRVTFRARPELELAASVAAVESPESQDGDGMDQEKWSASLRWAREPGSRGVWYALLEWERTDESFDGTRLFTYTSLLGEGTVRVAGTDVSLRLERTTRPEEERLLDLFRSPRPLSHFDIIGVTRWENAALGAAFPALRAGRVAFVPLAEVQVMHPVQDVEPSAFEPDAFYGSSTLWMFSIGVRMSGGWMPMRMGRYGAGAGGAPAVRMGMQH